MVLACGLRAHTLLSAVALCLISLSPPGFLSLAQIGAKAWERLFFPFRDFVASSLCLILFSVFSQGKQKKKGAWLVSTNFTIRVSLCCLKAVGFQTINVRKIISSLGNLIYVGINMKWYARKQQFQMPVELMYSIQGVAKGGWAATEWREFTH